MTTLPESDRASSTLRLAALVAALLATVAAPPADAGTAEERGLEIALEADRRASGFGDFTAELTMVLHDRRGRESTRELRNRTLEQEDDGDKTLIIFDHPKDVEGTALLIHGHETGDDDLWLYLPALERVKRISSSNKSGPFMGSEFAYEDLASTEVGKYDYRFLREEELDGVPTIVIERRPKDPGSGYTRQVVWIDREEYRTLKIDFYDRKEELLKTLTQSGFELFLDRFWQPTRLHMVNHQTGKTSDLLWSNYQFQTGLDDRDFDRASLARAR
jgi:hypothetical protein